MVNSRRVHFFRTKGTLFFLFLFLLFLLPKGWADQKNLKPVRWIAASIRSGEKLGVHFNWIVPREYQSLSASKGIWIEVWRAEEKDKYSRISPALIPQTTSFTDEKVKAGEAYFYKIRTTDNKTSVDLEYPGKVFLPPRGVDPVTNGRLLEYNEKYIKKALAWKFLNKEEVQKFKDQIKKEKKSLQEILKIDEYLYKNNYLSQKKSREIKNGRKEYYKMVEGKREYYKTKDNKNTTKFYPGVEEPPIRPSVEVIKESSKDSMPRLGFEIKWELSPDDLSGLQRVKRYIILRKKTEKDEFKEVGQVGKGTVSFRDMDRGLVAGEKYFYVIRASDGESFSDAIIPEPPYLSLRFFEKEKIFVFLAVIFFTAIFLYFVWEGKKGKELKLRRIEGLNAIEEAIGRATEMGKPVLYVPGIDDIQELQTVASLIILSHVSKTTALYETPVIVPCRDSVVMAMAEEVVRDSALSVGRPDTFNPDNIRYLSTEQFAYVAGVDGIMLREKPAANLYLGSFFAESLILAETGFESKAIQVAGTANYHQLPFFIVACDFTIIGEEFYAASAYLSNDPQIIGSVKAADYFKLCMIILIFFIVIGASIGAFFLETEFFLDLGKNLLSH